MSERDRLEEERLARTMERRSGKRLTMNVKKEEPAAKPAPAPTASAPTASAPAARTTSSSQVSSVSAVASTSSNGRASVVTEHLAYRGTASDDRAAREEDRLALTMMRKSGKGLNLVSHSPAQAPAQAHVSAPAASAPAAASVVARVSSGADLAEAERRREAERQAALALEAKQAEARRQKELEQHVLARPLLDPPLPSASRASTRDFADLDHMLANIDRTAAEAQADAARRAEAEAQAAREAAAREAARQAEAVARRAAEEEERARRLAADEARRRADLEQRRRDEENTRLAREADLLARMKEEEERRRRRDEEALLRAQMQAMQLQKEEERLRQQLERDRLEREAAAANEEAARQAELERVAAEVEAKRLALQQQQALRTAPNPVRPRHSQSQLQTAQAQTVQTLPPSPHYPAAYTSVAPAYQPPAPVQAQTVTDTSGASVHVVSLQDGVAQLAEAGRQLVAAVNAASEAGGAQTALPLLVDSLEHIEALVAALGPFLTQADAFTCVEQGRVLMGAGLDLVRALRQAAPPADAVAALRGQLAALLRRVAAAQQQQQPVPPARSAEASRLLNAVWAARDALLQAAPDSEAFVAAMRELVAHARTAQSLAATPAAGQAAADAAKRLLQTCIEHRNQPAASSRAAVQRELAAFIAAIDAAL